MHGESPGRGPLGVGHYQASELGIWDIMIMKSGRQAAVLAASFGVVALAGCGGGGGGGGSGSSSSAAPGPTFLTAPYGTSQSVSSSQASPLGTDKSSAAGQAVTITETTGKTAATLTVTTPMAGGTAGPTTTVNLPVIAVSKSGYGHEYQSTDGNSTIIATTFAGTTNGVANAPLTDVEYGAYRVFNASRSSAQSGGFFSGTPTAQSAMPGNITATYFGGFNGYASTSTGVATLSGSSALTANFSAGTVTGTIGSIANLAGSAQGYGISMNGTINGNTFSGTSAFTNSSFGAGTASTTSSALNGGFFGAGATQAAGALQLSGNASNIGSTTTPTTVVGGFGGKR